MAINFKKALNFQKEAGLVGGALGVRLTDKMLTKLNDRVRTLGQIGVGILLPPLLKAKPNSMVEKVGDGMKAVAYYKLLGNVPALTGVDDLDESIAGDGGYIVDDEYDNELSGLDDLDESIGNLSEEDMGDEFE